MVKPTTPVDVYIRVSRKGSREHFIAAEDQEAIARSFADTQGIALSGVVLQDIDQSGGTLDRPALTDARARVEAGLSGGVIVAYMSRLSRETRQGLELLEEITKAGGAVYAPNLPDYTTADGKMLTTIQLAIDAGYRERKREELERAKENSIANGVPIHSRPAVGYRARADRHLEPDPDIAPIIRELFERRARGDGPAALGRFLEERGVRTSQGSRTWSKPAIYGLIANRCYLGELAYGRDRRFVNAKAHKPIVDLALWQAAQHPSGRLAPPRGDGESPFLLTGVARCSNCGYALQATTTSRGKRIYRCIRTRAGGICPAPVRVPAEPLEDAVVAAFWNLTADLEAEGRRDTGGELRKLELDLARAEEALTGWISPAVQEAIGDLGEYAAGLRERREARDRAAEALGLERANSRDESLPHMPIETLRAAWERMPTGERRHLLGLRFDCVAVARDRSLVAYPTGTAPASLPRRGYRREPALTPFPNPPRGARVLAA